MTLDDCQDFMPIAKGLVSISIPFLNSERFLAEAVESVLAQTYNRWELFLVDDGSTDRSTAIAKEYSAKFPDKIYYLEHPGHRNCGLPASRNVGVRAGTGEYLAFLDSDDVWMPHKVEQQISLMNATPEAGFLYGLSEYWYDWEINHDPEQANEIPALAPGNRLYHPPELLSSNYPLGKQGAPCPSSFFLRRQAFNEIGGFEECFNPKTHQLYEDQAFLAKIYLHVPVFVADVCWDRYRCHSDSMGSRIEGTIHEEAERRYYVRWLERYLRQQAITDPEVWKAFRKQSWAYRFPLPVRAARFLRRIGSRITP
jgi:glycosyltransferase involved in cell wall biosynthesis